MRRTLLVLVLILGVSLAAAQERAPYTFADHIGMIRLSGPALSPDGGTIAYSQTAYDIAANRGASAIMLIPAAGGEPKKLTDGSGPVWSPDGKTIAFSRGGQIWLIPAAGGEAKQLTSFESGADGPRWSPDGTKILFSSLVWPGMTLEEVAAGLKELEADKVKAFATEKLFFRHWAFWRGDGRVNQLFVIDVASGAVHAVLKDFPYDAPPMPFGGSSDYEFSPDGSEIAFIAKSAPNPAWNTNLDLFVVPASGGVPENLTADNQAQDSGPVAYSPDGSLIAYGAMERPGFEADRIQLMVYERATGQRRSLTANFDSSAEGWVWTSDGKNLYFDAQEKGRKPLYRVSVTGNDVAKAVDGHTMAGVAVSPDGASLYFARQSLTSPVEIYRAAADGSGLTQLTFANQAALDRIAFSEVKEIWYEGADGDQVQMFMLLPPGFDETKKWPVVVLVHGGPQGVFGDDFHYRWSAQLFAAPGYIAVMPNFHGSTGYGQKFTDSITRNWGGTPYVDVMKAMDHLATVPYVDMNRVVAAGGSYGGYMINWIATQTDRFKALVSHSGVYNLESMYGSTEELWFPEWEYGGTYWENGEDYQKWSPHRFAANLGKFRTPVMVIHSQHDYRVPVTQGFEFYTALQRQGVPSRLLYYPDETHFVAKPQNAERWYNEVHAWFARWIGAGPTK